jgi:hypothetical protein
LAAQWRSHFRGIFFGALFGLFLFLAMWRQPLVHPYFDQVGIRDAGTVLSSVAGGTESLKTFVGQAMLHIEGPLQFVLLNVYAYTIGDLVPLTPATMAFPNALFALAAAAYGYLLGRKTYSERFGYWCALAFALGPWLGETLRQPWYFNTVSCFLHFSTLYYFLSLAIEPESRWYRIAAPACLTMYLFTGMDWPSFLFSLGLFVLLSGRFRILLRNPYNVLPVAAIAIQVAWPIALAVTGRERFLPGTMLLYPFLRYADLAHNPDFWPRVWNNVAVGWGPLPVIALAGLIIYLVRLRRDTPDRVRRALMDSLCIWFAAASYALVKSSTSATYLYVVAAPTAMLAALVLARLRTSHAVAVAAVLAAVQVYVTAQQFVPNADAGRRVLAAATFLIEQRPDLLARDKTAFLPRNVAADVGQYARGANRRIVMPQEFPMELSKHAIGSDEKSLLAFVDAYNREGRILADWIVLDSELYSRDLRASEFYARLARDPSVRWIARFDDPGGELIVGEVGRSVESSARQAPKLDTRGLSDIYEAKYDRISYLKKNVRYIDHY